jgi:hypothetical protein
MNRVVEQFRAPNAIQPGPNQGFLAYLLVGLQNFLSEIARRVNQTTPKDGSELAQMVSLDSTTLNITADLDDASPGYYSVVRCVLDAAWSLGGIVDGAGQEGVGGRVVTLVNASATDLTLTINHEDTGSAVANRFLLPRGLGVSLGQYMAMTFWYDLESLRWRVA